MTQSTDNLPINSFLRWAGSKRKLLPQLVKRIPQNFTRYVEPFAGSACLFFRLRPRSSLLSDINSELIITYKEVRDNLDGVWSILSKMRPDKESYYSARSLDSETLLPHESAARFIYLNRFCFNGLYRTNRQGKFNVPFGGGRSGSISLNSLKECSAALQGVDLLCASFEEPLAQVQQGDFVYIDPPYSIARRRVFNEYSNAAFGSSQLKVLRSFLEKFDREGIPFLVSYGFSREAIELGRGFSCSHTVVQRQIAGFAADRRKARELVIQNF